MTATAEMIIEDVPFASPPGPPPPTDELAAREGPVALHGRLLNVSRMATIGEMAAGVAHELNQPLTAIANYAHACERLLSRPQADVADVREALRQITVQTTRAAEILRRLRALAPTLPEVMVDPGQIQQVVLNLVRNSLDALAERVAGGGQIRIRTGLTADGEVELSVSDNGPGVSADAMKRIFDPFFSTKENGTGLGLAITHTIARVHGGSVGYRANVPTGACFHILLPTQPR